MKLEDFEYSPKAAADHAARTAPQRAAQQAIEQRNRQEARRLARQINEEEATRNQPITDEAALAKALLKLQDATSVKVGIERRKRR